MTGNRKNRRLRAHTNRSFSIESLEDRRLMAAINLANGVLTVTGDDVADDIRVLYNGETSSAYVADKATGQIKASRTFNTAAVTQVNINALAGDDYVDYNLIAPSVIHGGDGQDVIYGNEGPDQIYGDANDDTLYGKGGDDRVWGGDNRDLIDTGNGVDYGYGEGGDDTIIIGGYGSDNLQGGVGFDHYRFQGIANGSARLEETNLVETDVLDFSNMTQSVFVRLDLQSYQTPLAGIQISLAAGAFENVIGTQYDDTIFGNAGFNGLLGLGGVDHLYGMGDGDSLIGGDGDDFLYGFAGDDLLEGGRGNDYLSGDEGNDLYRYATAGGSLGSDTLVETAVVNSTDTLDFGPLDRGVTVNLNTTSSQTVAANFLSLSLSSATKFENVNGTNCVDVITGNGLDNYLRGHGNNDRLIGGAGMDRLEGGAGDDVLEGGADSDYYVFSGGSLGSDVIDDSSTSNGLDFRLSYLGVNVNLTTSSKRTINSNLSLTIKKPANITAVYGSEMNDLILGNDRDNYIDALGGDDWVWGGKGNDTIVGGAGMDYLYGEGGDDWLYADLIDAIVDGGTGSNRIYGRKPLPPFGT